MLRTAILGLTIIAAVAAFAVWSTSEPVYTLETPALGPAPVAVQVAEKPQGSKVSPSDIRVGSFERPDSVPRYEILEDKAVRAEDVRATRLLVDTEAGREDDYRLIAQDIKVRYAEYDAISVEFTDTQAALEYRGGALIFNTPEGAHHIGFYYGPPNSEGYYVRAAE